MNNTQKAIPKHWKWVTLDDIGIVVSGGTPSTKEPEFWNGNIPWITPADLSNHDEVYISKGNRNISQVGLEYSSAHLLPVNSIVFSSRAPIGYVAITKNELATNQGFKNLILPTELVNPKYVYYYLKTVKELAENMASGTTFLELSATKFRQIHFPLAPIEEQNRIVEKIEELFSELDKSIDNLEIAKAKSIYNIYSLYNQVFNKNNIENEIFIRELCTINYGKSLTKKERKNGKIPVYGSNGIIGYHNETYIEKPVIIIGRKGSVGELRFSNEKCYPIDTTYYIEENDSFDLKYLFYQLQIKELSQLSKSTTIPGLNREHIYDLKVRMPSTIEEQKLIVEYVDEKLNDIEMLSTNISESINKIKMVYLKILQEAFQGKLVNQLNTDTSTDILLKNIQKEKQQFLLNQQEIIRNRPKIKRMEKEKLSIIQVLEKNKKPIYAKQLWEDSMYNDNIEKFYSELKKVQDKIIEEKTEKGSLISLK